MRVTISKNKLRSLAKLLAVLICFFIVYSITNIILSPPKVRDIVLVDPVTQPIIEDAPGADSITVPSEPYFSKNDAINIYSLVNNYRKSNGKVTLDIDGRLESSAFNKALDLYLNSKWVHYEKSPEEIRDLIKRYGYDGSVGENMGQGYYDAQSLFKAWVDSPTHNNILLSPLFEDMGIAALCGIDFQNNKDNCIIVLHFGADNSLPRGSHYSI